MEINEQGKQAGQQAANRDSARTQQVKQQISNRAGKQAGNRDFQRVKQLKKLQSEMASKQAANRDSARVQQVQKQQGERANKQASKLDIERIKHIQKLVQLELNIRTDGKTKPNDDGIHIPKFDQYGNALDNLPAILDYLNNQHGKSDPNDPPKPPPKKGLLASIMSAFSGSDENESDADISDEAISDMIKSPSYQEYIENNIKQHEQDVQEYQKELTQEILKSDMSTTNPDIDI